MKCDQCGSNNASVKIMIQGVNEQENDILNLCQGCFNDFAKDHPDMKPAADFGSMMQAFFNLFNNGNISGNIENKNNSINIPLIGNNNNNGNNNIDINKIKNELLNLIGKKSNGSNGSSNINNSNNPLNFQTDSDNNNEDNNKSISNTGYRKFNSNNWKNSLNKICPNCKSSSKKFMTTGRLGCEKCYLSFKDEINLKLLQMTGENILTKFNKTVISNESKVYILKRDLNEAVEREDYELAARIRDDLKILVKH